MKPVIKRIIYMVLIFSVGVIGLIIADQYDFMEQLQGDRVVANSPRDLKTVQTELGQVGRGMPAESKIIKKQ